jgi:hypothetical protein
LRTTAVKKPRTEWGCQPVAFMIVAIVVPWGFLSKASTASCLVPPRAEGEGTRPGFADGFATLLARAILVFVRVLLCDMLRSFFGGDGTLRHHHRSPAMAASPAGQDPGGAKTGPSLGTATLTLSLLQKSTPFCDENTRDALTPRFEPVCANQ